MDIDKQTILDLLHERGGDDKAGGKPSNSYPTTSTTNNTPTYSPNPGSTQQHSSPRGSSRNVSSLHDRAQS